MNVVLEERRLLALVEAIKLGNVIDLDVIHDPVSKTV